MSGIIFAYTQTMNRKEVLMKNITQPSSNSRMRELLDSLDFSLRAELVPPMLHTLHEIACVLVDQDKAARAYEILTCVAQYPLPSATATSVSALLDELEFQVCPRVVVDARQRANEITLDDLAAEVLEQRA